MLLAILLARLFRVLHFRSGVGAPRLPWGFWREAHGLHRGHIGQVLFVFRIVWRCGPTPWKLRPHFGHDNVQLPLVNISTALYINRTVMKLKYQSSCFILNESGITSCMTRAAKSSESLLQ